MHEQVTITLEEPDTGTTVLRLRQTGIPSEDRCGNGDMKRSAEIGASCFQCSWIPAGCTLVPCTRTAVAMLT